MSMIDRSLDGMAALSSQLGVALQRRLREVGGIALITLALLAALALASWSVQDPSLSQGVAFFAFLRKMTCDGFYTSKIGIADLQYIGNTSRREFPGCPPVPDAQA